MAKNAQSSAIGSDLKRVRAMRDEEISYRDLPDLSGEDWTHATPFTPPRKVAADPAPPRARTGTRKGTRKVR
jgi:hypothetical protein